MPAPQSSLLAYYPGLYLLRDRVQGLSSSHPSAIKSQSAVTTSGSISRCCSHAPEHALEEGKSLPQVLVLGPFHEEQRFAEDGGRPGKHTKVERANEAFSAGFNKFPAFFLSKYHFSKTDLN